MFPGLEERIHSIENQAGALLPETASIASPLEALSRYQENAPRLTYLLFAFSVPILSLILAFIGLVAGLFVNQQRGEMAILRSRGASTSRVVGISLYRDHRRDDGTHRWNRSGVLDHKRHR